MKGGPPTLLFRVPSPSAGGPSTTRGASRRGRPPGGPRTCQGATSPCTTAPGGGKGRTTHRRVGATGASVCDVSCIIPPPGVTERWVESGREEGVRGKEKEDTRDQVIRVISVGGTRATSRPQETHKQDKGVSGHLNPTGLEVIPTPDTEGRHPLRRKPQLPSVNRGRMVNGTK